MRVIYRKIRYFLFSHGNYGYANGPQCSVIRTLPVSYLASTGCRFRLLAWNKLNLKDPFESFPFAGSEIKRVYEMLRSRKPQDLGGRGQEIKTHHQTLSLPTFRNKLHYKKKKKVKQPRYRSGVALRVPGS